MKYLLLSFLGIILTHNIYSQPESSVESAVPDNLPLFSGLHTLSIHVRDTLTQDSVFHFLVDRLKLPVYYNTVKYGSRKYSGVYAGNLVLEPCGPYSNFSYASNDFRAIFFGLTFEPYKTISLSAKGLADRKILHEEGDSYIYINDASLCGENITISFLDKGDDKTEDKRVMDSLLTDMTKATGNEPGIEYVKEIWIGYKDNANLQTWEELIMPEKLMNDKIWKVRNLISFHFVNSGIREVKGITFKVRSLKKANEYLLQNKLSGDYTGDTIILDKSQAFGLQIVFTEQN